MDGPFDYLYADRKRISAYFDQLAPDALQGVSSCYLGDAGATGRTPPLSEEPSDCLPGLHAKASFVLERLSRKGCVAGAFLFDALRQTASHDKGIDEPFLTDAVDASLGSNQRPARSDLYHNFPGSRSQLASFVHARLLATKVVFPSAVAELPDAPGIAVWLHWHRPTASSPSGVSRFTNAWMIEGLSRSDVDIRSPKACRYSALTGILVEHSPSVLRTVLSKHEFVRDLATMNFRDFQIRHSSALDRLMFEYSDEVAVQLGAEVVYPSLEVDVLCRVRDYASYVGMGNHVYAQAVFVRVAPPSNVECDTGASDE